jgi:hypothetical protein
MEFRCGKRHRQLARRRHARAVDEDADELAARLAEAAARLFEGLRALDAEGARLGLSGIAVMPVPQTGLGLAINDRLARAAAPRG